MIHRKEPVFIEVQPFEYQKRSRTKEARLITYWGFRFNPHLTVEKLRQIASKLKTKRRIDIMQNPNELLIWQCEGKPLIGLGLKEQKFYTTQGTLNHYRLRTCQQQASLILRVLKGSREAHFKRRAITLDLNRLGRTSKEREKTYRALELFLRNGVDTPRKRV